MSIAEYWDAWMRLEWKRMLRCEETYARIMKMVRDDRVITQFKENSSYFMRKQGHPLIIKREGLCKESVLAQIIKCAKILDAAVDDVKSFYIPVPTWLASQYNKPKIEVGGQ